MCSNPPLLRAHKKLKRLANWPLSAESFHETTKVLIFSLNGVINDGTDVPAHKTFSLKLPPRLYSAVPTRWPGLNYRPRTWAQDSSFYKTRSVSGNVNLIFRRTIQRSACGSRGFPPFILVSLESGYLDTSQQLAFSRRGSRPDSAQKSCRRRPSDEGPEKAANASSSETLMETGGLGCTPRLDTPRLGGWLLLAGIGGGGGPLITAPDRLERKPVPHPQTLALRGYETGPPGGAPTGIPEADARWMRRVCVAVSAGWRISGRRLYLFPAEAPRRRSSPPVSGKPSIPTPAHAMKSSVCLPGL